MLIEVDVGDCEVCVVLPALLELEIVLELPRESLEETLEFIRKNLVVVVEGQHQFHVVPVFHCQQQVVFHCFVYLEGVVDVNCQDTKRSWVFELDRQDLLHWDVLLGEVDCLLAVRGNLKAEDEDSSGSGLSQEDPILLIRVIERTVKIC